MQNTTTQWRWATQFLKKIYFSLYLKGCAWEGFGDRTELQHICPRCIGHNRVSFPFSWDAQPGAWGPTLLGAGFLYRILSPMVLDSKLIWLPVFTGLYNCSTSTFLWASQIALIQPIHGQGYNILIDRMHLLFTKVNFLYWQPGRVVGQYTTYIAGHLPSPNSKVILLYIRWLFH